MKAPRLIKCSWFDSRSPVSYPGIFLLSVLLSVAFVINEVNAEAVGEIGIVIDVNGDTTALPLYWRPSLRAAKAHSTLLPPRQEMNRLAQDINFHPGYLAVRLDMDKLPGGLLPGQSIRPGSKLIDFIKDWQSKGGDVILTLGHLPLGPWDGSKWLYDVLDEDCVADCDPELGGDPNPYGYGEVDQDLEWDIDDCRRLKCGRSAPDWDAYYDLMIDLIKYLTLPPKIGRTVENEILFGNRVHYNTQGIDHLYILFWDEPNQYHYKDDTWQGSEYV